ncbi:BRO family protein [Lacrimispora indolis]|uniref:BRO family protein n=1 Tax=Lacrimispora indolis TaxID=69825 RepID=UPI00041C8A0D|nr:BRO family protein [[Clostridium] methoxybenzovorans]
MKSENKVYEVKLFSNEKFGDIRTVTLNGNPWFVAKDVCDILNIQNVTQATQQLEDFERSMFNIGRQGEANIISESGFYTLVLRSRKPIAKPFRIWVTSEVLPSIRKTGSYVADSGKMESILSNMGIDLKVVYAQINNMEIILEGQVERFNSVMENMTISTRQQEKILKAARNRVNYLLGGAHSEYYRIMGRTYLANLWNNFKSELHCGSSYKDLNPADFDRAIDWINQWEYIES